MLAIAATSASATRVQRLPQERVERPRATIRVTPAEPAGREATQARPTPPAPARVGPEPPGEESLTAGPPGTPAAPAAAGADPAADAEDNVHGTSNDLLADNGLRSPWCAPGRRVNPEGERNCRTSGLASSGAGGDNASFDRHVDTSTWTGAPKIDRWFISIVLTILSFAWTLMVTLTRGVFTALEFAFAFNPLDRSHRGSLAATLDHQVRTVTRPLALMLAPAGAVWLMWSTTVARRPGYAASQALLSSLLVTGALIVLANPIGTVGAALTASQRVGLAVIGATAGQPSSGERAAQSGLQAMADGVIDQPLALLEFGDVDWGTNPRRIDARLRDAALALARNENPEKVAAVRAARSNLDLVQVWPANSRQRNAINDEGSLLRVLCRSDEDTDCQGPTARYAEFRTERGAWQRALGLIVILLGLLPFWIALTFVAVKVIAAGLMAAVRLVQLSFLTPLALIGEHGNRRLTSFAGDFVGNVLTAAAYSFFLGLIMLLWRLITAWPGYGFVMQWLLLALALWLLIAHRQSLWGTAHAPGSAAMGIGGQVARYAATTAAIHGGTRAARLPGRSGQLALGSARRVSSLPVAAARRVRRPGATPPAAAEGKRHSVAGPVASPPGRRASSPVTPVPDVSMSAAAPAQAGSADLPAARRLVREQNQRMAEGALAHRLSVADAADLPTLRERRARLGGELQAVTEALDASTGQDRTQLVRRRASLAARRDDVHAAINRAEQSSTRARAAQDNPGRDRTILARRLDQQAALSRGEFGPGERRQYAQLAPLAGASPQQYRAASPDRRLQMRADVDRELQRRTHARQLLREHQQNTGPRPPRRDGQHAPANTPRQAQTDQAPGRGVPARPASPAGRTAAQRRQAFREQARRRD